MANIETLLADTRYFLDQGSDPAAPGAGERVLYTKAGGIYLRSSSGIVGPLLDETAHDALDHTGLTGVGGGGGGGSSPDDPPASPHAQDDEFDGSSSATWTTFETPTTWDINTSVPHRAYLVTPANLRLVGATQALPSFPFTVTAKIGSHAAARRYIRAGGLVFLTGATPAAADDRVYFGMTNIANADNLGPYLRPNRILYSDNTTFGSETLGPILGTVPFYYVRATLASATSVTLQWSLDGTNWATLQTAYNPGFTIARVGLGAAGELPGGGTEVIAATFEFFRIT